MNRRIWSPVICFFALVVLSIGVNAQSMDRANPTKLTSNEISGLVDSDSRGKFYYYSFTANPGEVSITLTVEPGRPVNSSDLSLTTISFSLYDRNAVEVASKGVVTSPLTGSQQGVARVEVTRRQVMVLGIKIAGEFYHRGVGGKYRIRIDGADLGQGISSVSTDKTDSSACLPKQGTLIIKMKDGSKKIIDLAEAESVTVVP